MLGHIQHEKAASGHAEGFPWLRTHDTCTDGSELALPHVVLRSHPTITL